MNEQIQTNPLPDFAFRQLDASEQAKFKKWARANYVKGQAISGLWHPVIRSECWVMNLEN